MSIRSFAPGAAVAILLAAGGPAAGFDASSITIKVGYGPGGTYDLSSRLIAEHIGKHLPGNPGIIVENVPGGGSLKLTTLMLGNEPRDGTVIASISPAMPFAPILDPDNVSFDPDDIVWLGSIANDPGFCVTSKASGIDTMEKFLTEDFHVGASGKGSQTYQQAAIVKNGVGARFNLVTGFEGVAEIELAMERGEIAGHCSSTVLDLTRRNLLGEVNLIGRFGAAAPAGHEGPPRFSGMITDETLRKGAELIEAVRDISYPMMVPRGTPDETIAVLRDAYWATVTDPEFIAAAEALGEFTLAPTSGADVQAIINGHLAAGAEALAAARTILE